MKLHKILIVLGISSLLAVMLLAGLSPTLAASEGVTGTVMWFSGGKGYGFIEMDSGADISVQSSAIEDSGDRYLEKGDRVAFTVEEGPEGLQATNVRRITQ
jgi:cold shock protein